MRKQGKTSSFMGSAAMAALALAAFGSALLLRKEHHVSEFNPDMTIEGDYRVVDGEVREAENPMVKRAAAAAMLTGMTASVIGIFGPNRFLNMLLGFGSWLAGLLKKGASEAASASAKAAKSTVKAAAKVAKRPGQWLLIVGGLTLFVFTGISVLDIQWQAGLVAGAGATAAAFYGFDKTGEMLGSVANSCSDAWGRFRSTFTRKPAAQAI
jgi:hypothetical protein